MKCSKRDPVQKSIFQADAVASDAVEAVECLCQGAPLERTGGGKPGGWGVSSLQGLERLMRFQQSQQPFPGLKDALGRSWLWSPSIRLAVSPRCESSLPEGDFSPPPQVCELSVELKLQSQRSLRFRATNEELRRLESPLGPCWVTPGVGHTTTALPGESQQEELRDLLPLSLHLPSQVRSCSICISSRRCVHVRLWSWLLGALPWLSDSLGAEDSVFCREAGSCQRLRHGASVRVAGPARAKTTQPFPQPGPCRAAGC